MPPIRIPIQEEMVTHSQMYLGRIGHLFLCLSRRRQPLTSILMQKDMPTHSRRYLGSMTTHSHIHVGGNGHSFPYNLSRMHWPLIPTKIYLDWIVQLFLYLSRRRQSLTPIFMQEMANHSHICSGRVTKHFHIHV